MTKRPAASPIAWAFAGLVLPLAAGCDTGPASSNADLQVAPATFTSLKPTIKASCALSASCHSSAPNRSGGIDLETDPYAALVNQPTVDAAYPKAKQTFPTLVIPGNAAQSFLYVKLTLPLGIDPNLGSSMPQASAKLDAATIAAFKSWIDAGARND